MLDKIEKHPVIFLLCCVVIFIGIIPASISLAVKFTFFNLVPETDNRDWLGYWFTYGGNVIGLIGLGIVTAYQDKRQRKILSQQDEHQQQYLNEQNKMESNRLKAEMKVTLINKNIDDVLERSMNLVNLSTRLRLEGESFPTTGGKGMITNDFNLRTNNYEVTNLMGKEINIINSLNILSCEVAGIYPYNLIVAEKLSNKITFLLMSTDWANPNETVESYINKIHIFNQTDKVLDKELIDSLEQKLKSSNPKVIDHVKFAIVINDLVEEYHFNIMLGTNEFKKSIARIVKEI